MSDSQKKNERRKQARRDWRAEIARLQQRQAQKNGDRRERSRRHEDILIQIHAMILTPEFAEYYMRNGQAMSLESFRARVLLTSDEFLRSGIPGSQLEWTRALVEALG